MFVLGAGTRVLLPGTARASWPPLLHYNSHQLDRFHARFLDKYDYGDECFCFFSIDFFDITPMFITCCGSF